MKVTDKITITNEDCMELLKRTPDNFYDLSICDPPYGINADKKNSKKELKTKKSATLSKDYGSQEWDSEVPNLEYFNELKRVSKNQIIWGGNYMLQSMSASGKCDINTPCWIMWDKKFSEDVTFAQFELAWTSFKTSAKKFESSPNQLNRIHPTQKPVALYKWLLDKYSKQLDKEYFDKAMERINNHTQQQKLF